MNALTASRLYRQGTEPERFSIRQGHTPVEAAEPRHIDGLGLVLVGLASGATYRPDGPLQPGSLATTVTRYRPAGYVLAAGYQQHLVLSRTTPGAWWLVEGDTCSCPSTRPRCWHMVQRDLFINAEARANARPSGRPNVSALVD